MRSGRWVCATLLMPVVFLLPLVAGAQTTADYRALAAGLIQRSGRPVTLDIIDSTEVFSRIHMADGRIEISSALLDGVDRSAGRAGVAFLLGHEIAHTAVAPSFQGAAVEFEADRLGFDLARQVVPDVQGTTVRQVFAAFDTAGPNGPVGTMLDKIRGAVSPSHPTDASRLAYLAESYDYDAKLGFDGMGRRTGQMALPAPAAPKAGVARAVDSVRRDFLHGGLVLDVAVTAGLSIVSRVTSGESLGESLGDTATYLTSGTFLVGDVLGGVVGAALGSMIPIPGSWAAAGLFGQALASLPALGGAMLGAQVGIAAFTLWREGRLTLSNLSAAVDLVGTTARAVGASIGMAVGCLVPLPVVGPLLGGIVGGWLMDRLLTMLRGPQTEAVSEATAAAAAGGDVSVGKASDGVAGRPITIDHLKAARDAAYEAFIVAVEADDTTAAVEHLRRYREIEDMLKSMVEVPDTSDHQDAGALQ